MSVTELAADARLGKLLDSLLPNVGAPQLCDAIVPRRTSRPQLMGTAFDYAVRLELQRRCPDAESREWIAETSVADLVRRADAYGGTLELVIPNLRRARKARIRTRSARTFLRRHTRVTPLTPVERRALCAHAWRLACLDAVYRSGACDDTLFGDATEDEIAELLALLGLFPFDQLSVLPLSLNPSFGRFSELVGGADADLIVDGRLIDIKVVKEPVPTHEMLRQLALYTIISELHRGHDESGRQIASLEVYFARHGIFFQLPAAPLLRHPQFGFVTNAVIKEAERRYGRADGDTDRTPNESWIGASAFGVDWDIVLRRDVGRFDLTADRRPVGRFRWFENRCTQCVTATQAIARATGLDARRARDALSYLEFLMATD